MAIPETPGERIRHAMKAAGAKNADLAGAAGVHVKTVSYWLNGQFEPSDDALRAIAARLRVSEAWLKYGDQAPAPAEPVPRHARNLPLSVREYLLELRRRLMRADVPDDAIDEAMALVRSPEVFSFFVGGTAREFTESDVLANVKAFAEESIIPTLKRRGYKL